MATPLPSDETVDLRPPEPWEVDLVAAGVASAVAPSSGLTDLQRVLIESMFGAMTGHAPDIGAVPEMSPSELGRVLARRNLAYRTRIVRSMLLGALVLRPLPGDVVERVGEAARELEVDDAMVGVARDFADGALGLAAFDFERNGYTSHWRPEDGRALHTSVALASPWDVAVADETLAARWIALGELPPGTLGRGVWELYRARGFRFPGSPGSAPPLLAQHDWVHVLADYGTTVESELEVFAFIARANDDARAFSLLAMVVSLFETGYLRSGAGLFEADPGHLSAGHGMAVRVSDAMRRGALCRDSGTGQHSVDYLALDWFGVAPLPIDEVRRRFAVTGKSVQAREAGSVGPTEPGGISEFQRRAGAEMAAAGAGA